ncbi:ABC transporter ATP-binding protein [Bradyrhizobium sp. CCGB12]|uniref:ABC transporter ATP-binding protein n=1 Tax=Bradyrhizobium sp. CCGB12 TaxID=2949632 RepID=UPI0020B3CDDD|nr:ATP-binding cassette domain-containing protein [Bradyrhizobium sp. CCGB12]MCP3395314.1 ABC transporter ATP-binding protein [Bradyrhizobium sp. CCGB12]
MLELRNLEVRYGKLRALNGINLQVREGEIVALLGANGAGKTTALRAISGLLAPSSGDILYRGSSIAKRRPDLIVRDGIAQSPEERHIWPELSVRENLSLGAYCCPDRALAEQRFESVLQRFPRLRERLSQLAGLLSGGEQQMLAIGRALMSGPKLLLLDEPSLGLSPLMSQEVLGALRELCQQGITILIVEQNVHSALSVASRAYVFETGRVVGEGSAADMLGNPDLLRAYLGA